MGRAFEFRKARKMKRWSAMSKAFTRIGKEITLATKESGPNPEANIRLRMAIQNAKAANMPKDNIERAIKKAMDKDAADLKEMVYEGYAPHGIAIMVETLTDNHVRTVADVRSYFRKCDGTLGNSGSVEFMFEHKCFFQITKPEMDLEELELEMIDYGVEEIFEDEEGVMLYAMFPEFGNIQAALDKMNLEIISSGFERIPMDNKQMTEEQQADVNKLLDMLEENDDVQAVWHNMEEI